MDPFKFSDNLLMWFDRHGRKSLPWYKNRDPYAIWVSEIMLQQTQVNTVIPYYENFMDRFPDVRSLAQASIDRVLQHWAGLGYYARGRNLHRASTAIMEHHNGEFPRDFESVIALPGVGRSTAGAILAQAFGQRHAILDGNVKRVLARQRRIDGYPGESRVQKQLWSVAEQLTPHMRLEDYTQAIMDLGAMVCVRDRPLCDACPVADSCEALAWKDVSRYPGRKTKSARRKRSAQFLLLSNDRGQLYLQQRPPSGIWGGLWCLPELESDIAPVDWVDSALGRRLQVGETWPSFIHKFTHYDLELTPIIARVEGVESHQSADSEVGHWYDAKTIAMVGLPKPIEWLVQRYFATTASSQVDAHQNPASAQ